MSDFPEYTQEDIDLYHELTVKKGLPTLAGLNNTGKDKYGNPLPYGVGPHSVDAFRKISSIVKPKSILEIGFNMGWSASLWLHFTEAKLTSVDISDKDETLFAASVLKEKHPDRFEFILSDSKDVYSKLKDKNFDMIFIDGDHTFDGVKTDMQLAKDLNIKNVVMDDWLPQYGPGVQPAAKIFNIVIDEVVFNIALGHF